MATCPTHHQLELLLEASLHESEQARIESHVDTCAACQETLEQMTAGSPPIHQACLSADEVTFIARVKQSSRDADLGLNLEPLQATRPQTPPDVPGYQIERELGQGGMGVVYLARHRRLNRLVALKMLTEGALRDPSLRSRFQLEAETVAQLRHPHVVQVYEFGEHAGTPYFAMEYIEGGTLGSALATSGVMPAFDAAHLLASVARGIQAVHDVGVVHRDLKPGNILLEKSADLLVPKVTDFGIAKRGGTHDLTSTGMVMGTPAYMAPEQATGDTRLIGIGADIYSLGVMLYECISGRTPFVAESPHSLMFKLIHDEPPPLRKFAATAPRDLELICEKCLAKTLHQRYASAAALADDLDRFIAGEPVSVSPPGTLEKAIRWVRKYPTRAAVYGLTMLAFVLGGIATGATVLYREADSLREVAIGAKQDADDARGRAEAARAIAETASRQLEVEKAAHDTDLAYREYEAANVPLAQTLLDGVPAKHRHWEWHYTARLCGREVRRLSYPMRGPIDPWNVFLNVVAFTSAGELFTSGMAGVRLWPAKGESIPVHANGEAVTTAAISRDGKRVAIVMIPDTVVLSLPDRKEIARFKGLSSSVSLSGDGTRLVRGPVAGEVFVHDLSTGVTRSLLKGVEFGNAAVISSDGKRIATAQRSVVAGREVGLVQVWSEAGEVSPFQFVVGTKKVPAVAFSNDGTKLVAGNEDGEVMAWEVRTGTPLGSRVSHPAGVNAVAFNPSGKLVATACADRVVRVWADHKIGGIPFLALTFKGHTAPVTSVAFSPDGNQLVSASADGTVRYWDVSGIPDTLRLPLGGQHPVIAALPDSNRLAVADVVNPLSVYDLKTGRAEMTKKADHIQEIYSISVDADGSQATVFSPIGYRSYSLTDADSPGTPWAKKPILPMTASADGKRTFTRTEKTGQVGICDDTGRLLARTRLDHRGQAAWMVCSDDGRRLVTGGWDRNAILWDATTGTDIAHFIGHNSEVTKAAISPDGTRIATGVEDGVIKVWDVKTRRAVLTFPSLQQRITGLCWSRDGHTLYAANRHALIQVFDGKLPNGE